jgi:hypothetical protein
VAQLRGEELRLLSRGQAEGGWLGGGKGGACLAVASSMSTSQEAALYRHGMHLTLLLSQQQCWSLPLLHWSVPWPSPLSQVHYYHHNRTGYMIVTRVGGYDKHLLHSRFCLAPTGTSGV